MVEHFFVSFCEKRKKLNVVHLSSPPGLGAQGTFGLRMNDHICTIHSTTDMTGRGSPCHPRSVLLEVAANISDKKDHALKVASKLLR